MSNSKTTTENEQDSNDSFFSKFGNLFSFLNDDRLKFSVAIFIFLLAVFFIFAFISYLFTWKVDQSKLDVDWSKFILDSDIKVDNWTGKLGALASNLFIHNWFGIASFSIILPLILIGFKLLFNIKLLPFLKSLKYVVFLTVWSSITLGYFFGESLFNLGGAHGYFMSNWLNAILGKIGTAFFLIISIFTFVAFAVNDSVVWLKKVFTSKPKEKIIPPVIVTEEENAEDDDENQEEEEIEENDIEEADEDEVKEEMEVEIQEESNLDLKKEVPFEIISIAEPIASELITEVEPELELEIINNSADDFLDDYENQPISELENYDPTLDLSHYKFPPVELLLDHKSISSEVSEQELISNKNLIVETLGNFGIKITSIKATIGPTITLYEIIPAPGVRISKIKNLEDDIALSLSALGIRIIAPIPGRGTIGIEVPNQNPEIVSMRSIIESSKFQDSKYELPLGLGKTISNEPFVVDLAKMPHMLVAGATGQGKSVGLNAILTSLLYKKHPSQLKFVLIDPKKVELTLYSKIERHYLARLDNDDEAIITDTQKVITTLNSLCKEMDQRYDLLKKAHARNIKEYNDKFIKRRLNPENGHHFLPYIVVVIDEFADLIMTAGKEVETPIARIAQLARAIGIHLIIATQRPSANIITGIIKANFPVRLAFKVASMIDSRTILDSPGANQLIGKGDMLISQGSELIRLQCALVDTPEIEEIIDYIGNQQGYPTALYLPDVEDFSANGNSVSDADMQKRDELFDDAARLVVNNQQGSTSLIQRKFSIGYNRAGRIIDQLESAGIVGAFEGSKARKVMFQDEYSLEQFLNTLDKQESTIGRQ